MSNNPSTSVHWQRLLSCSSSLDSFLTGLLWRASESFLWKSPVKSVCVRRRSALFLEIFHAERENNVTRLDRFKVLAFEIFFVGRGVIWVLFIYFYSFYLFKKVIIFYSYIFNLYIHSNFSCHLNFCNFMLILIFFLLKYYYIILRFNNFFM